MTFICAALRKATERNAESAVADHHSGKPDEMAAQREVFTYRRSGS